MGTGLSGCPWRAGRHRCAARLRRRQDARSALEAAGPDLNPDSFREAMEGIAFYDAINDVELNYGEDHQGSNLVVISQIRDGMWHEVARVEQEAEGRAA
jgi:hypothetical protein